MNRFLNITLVLSIITNVILGWKRSPIDSAEPTAERSRIHQSSIIPQERRLSLPADRIEEGARTRRAIAVPWALVKEGYIRSHRIDFQLPDTVIQGLELTKDEQRAFDKAVFKITKTLREIETAGIQDANNPVVRVELDQDRQQVALHSFVTEIEQSLSEAKATIVSEAAAADNYLNWSSLELAVIETTNGMQFKVAHSNRSGSGGGSQSRSLTSHEIPDLRERWGHLLDFGTLEELLKTRESLPKP